VEDVLDKVEERVLGVLIEKGLTTPDYYPLTLNSLTTGCNQKSNRNPVLEFDEKMVVRALDSLREKGLIRQVSGADQRVPKYYHRFDEVLGFSAAETAVLCELMLRGPQTVGELRGRGSRLHEFAALAEVESVLLALADREGGGIVLKLPRQSGLKESRYAHLMAGEPPLNDAEADDAQVSPEKATLEVRAENERLDELEATVSQLQSQLHQLSQHFEEFRRQFE
jgi:uncharacterized protein YceH (UPF0502 family)